MGFKKLKPKFKKIRGFARNLNQRIVSHFKEGARQAQAMSPDLSKVRF